MALQRPAAIMPELPRSNRSSGSRCNAKGGALRTHLQSEGTPVSVAAVRRRRIGLRRRGPVRRGAAWAATARIA